MPELPDVAVFKQYLDATALHQQIETVEVHNHQVLEGVSTEGLKAALVGRTFDSTERHGKWLFVALDDGNWLVLHFGMTGNLKYFRDRDEEPEYDRLLIRFTNGAHLAYESMRKLGEINVVEDPRQFIEDRDLGPDALSPDLDLTACKEVLKGRRGMAKSTLMNQHVISGIGNVYSDEILFQAGVHPRAKIRQLDEGTLEDMYHAMKDVLHTAIEHQAIAEGFPDSYIIPQRHGDGVCPECGSDLERARVSGRTAYYCPSYQVKASEQAGQSPRSPTAG
jgi:formamidopyrimidine-DNA glycosylase